ncbi:hypothetical protein [Mesorhizobium sp. AR07]|uniref:hypothetical protein n=1 Tax=Mesorhizobium sp. AR07 TaxID=2865838 RepID=UPI0039B6F160
MRIDQLDRGEETNPLVMMLDRLDKVRRNAIRALGIAAPDDATADVLGELQFELRRVPTIWTS